MKVTNGNIQVLAVFVCIISSCLAVVAFSSNVERPSSSSSTRPLTTAAASATSTASDGTMCPNSDNAPINDHDGDLNNDDNYNNKFNSNRMTSDSFRSVKRILPKPRQHWVGDGFHVYPVFADLAFREDLSPLLMFDYAAPKRFEANEGALGGSARPRGVGRHPHRGFETVTIAFQGEIEHRDNKGHSGVIGPGDVQWMTAGRGIVHEEYHSQNFTKVGGTLEMCQLWVNLPKKHKMTKPRYQAILKDQIPTVTLPVAHGSADSDGVSNGDGTPSVAATVRLIAGGSDVFGDSFPAGGAAKTFSPVQMWDVHLPHARTHVDIPFPPDQNCIVFVRRGGIQIGNGTKEGGSTGQLGPQDVAVMHRDGTSTTLRIHVDQPDTSLLIMGGKPLEEPIAAQGPFVMNTQQELQQAMSDYRAGKF